MGKLIFITLVTGVLSLGLGAVIGVFAGNVSKKLNAMLLSFSAGTMLALICFELLHHAMSAGTGILPVGIGVLGGALLVTVLDYVVDKRSGHTHDFITCADCDEEFSHDVNHEHCDHDHNEGGHEHNHEVNNHENHSHKGHDYEERNTEPEHHNKKASHLQLLLAGIMMAIGIAIHNIPEGMSIGVIYAAAGGSVEAGLITLLVGIILHNIPEGMAVALPLRTSGMSSWKAVGIAAISGFPTILGAVLGYMIGDMGALALCLSLSFAAGTLLYVVFGEVMPQSINLYCSRKTAFAGIMGFIIGMLIIGTHVH